MARAIAQYGPWPGAEHQLLLRAALGDATGSVDAWQEWRRRYDLDAIDAGSLRLLPLVYRNLTRAGVDPQALGRVRGVYRQTWYRNQLIIGHLAGLIRRLEAAGIDTLVLKGIPLALAYYGEAAVRPMADADLLIPSARAVEAMAVLGAAGWTPRGEPLDWPPRFTGSRAFTNALDLEVDVHVHVLHDCLEPDADQDFWRAARPITVGDAATRMLCAADQLLHVIVHGFRRSTVPPVRWVSDAVTIIRQSGSDLDWPRFVSIVSRRRFGRIASATLAFLRTEFGLDVPPETLRALQRLRPSVDERLEYWSRVRPGRAQLGVEAWCEYRRAAGRESHWSGPLGFIRYIKDRLGVEDLRDLPSAAAAKASFRRFETTTLRAGHK
jgi:hypothetical protein